MVEKPNSRGDIPAAGAGANSTKKPRWRDIPCIFVFLAFLIGFVVITALDLKDYAKTQCFHSQFGDSRVVFFRPQMLALLGICILFTFVFSLLYYCIAAMYTGRFILIAMVLQVLVSLGSSVFYLTQGQLLSGSFGLLWLVFSSILYWMVRGFITSATVQLDLAMRLAQRNPTIIFISVLGALFCSAWSVLVGSVILAGLGKAITEDCSSNNKLRPEGEFLALLAYLAISNYLVTEVVKGVVRVATCYTFGWWCLMPHENDHSHTSSAVAQDEFPSMPSVTWLGAFAAVTYNLGSVCISGLVLAFVKLLAQVLAAWSQALVVNSTLYVRKDISIILLAWILSNCVSYIDALIVHFSNYILVYVAVDNVSYFDAVKRCAELIVGEGFNALLNDCLAAGTLTFGSWCIATVVTLLAYVYMRWLEPYPLDGIFLVCSYIMLMSLQVSNLLTVGISSGVQTVFVAISSEPMRVKQVHPRVYSALATSFVGF